MDVIADNFTYFLDAGRVIKAAVSGIEKERTRTTGR
jgi:hypothetical protein